jgi:hypothetical protein
LTPLGSYTDHSLVVLEKCNASLVDYQSVVVVVSTPMYMAWPFVLSTLLCGARGVSFGVH